MISQKFQIEECNACVTPASRLERCEMKTKSDWSEQEEDLFCEALSRADPAKHAAILDQACAGKPVLRARVEEMLAVHAEAERFFSSAEQATHLKPDDIQTAVSTLLNLCTR
jgi:hypothetical protein